MNCIKTDRSKLAGLRGLSRAARGAGGESYPGCAPRRWGRGGETPGAPGPVCALLAPGRTASSRRGPHVRPGVGDVRGPVAPAPRQRACGHAGALGDAALHARDAGIRGDAAGAPQQVGVRNSPIQLLGRAGRVSTDRSTASFEILIFSLYPSLNSFAFNSSFSPLFTAEDSHISKVMGGKKTFPISEESAAGGEKNVYCSNSVMLFSNLCSFCRKS